MRRPAAPPRADLLLATSAMVLALLETTTRSAIAPKAVAIPAELALAGTLAWRRSAPLAATLVNAVVAGLETAFGVPFVDPFVPLLTFVVLAYSLTSYSPVRRAVLGSVVLLASAGMQGAVQHAFPSPLTVYSLFLVAMWFMGIAVRRRTAQAVELASTADRLQREREDGARAAAAAERGRIARELHDVISHSVSVMVVQAGAAEEVLRQDPTRAVEPIRAVQSTGREALAELSRLLGVLREHGEELGLAPQPGVADLDRLVAQSRASGIDVEFCIDGALRTLPPGVGLAVYRIVQEALTNARKHGDGASAAVHLTFEDSAVEVSVTNALADSPNGYGGGHGLIGMRERVSVYGGSLQAGREREGRYAVRARIPVPHES